MVTEYTGQIPDRKTMDDVTFTQAVYDFLKYINDDFVPSFNDAFEEVQSTTEVMTDEFVSSVNKLSTVTDSLIDIINNLNAVVTVSNSIDAVKSVAEAVSAVVGIYDRLEDVKNISANMETLKNLNLFLPGILKVADSIENVNLVADNFDALNTKLNLILELSNFKAGVARVSIYGVLYVDGYDLPLELDEDGNLVLTDDTVNLAINENELIYYK